LAKLAKILAIMADRVSFAVISRRIKWVFRLALGRDATAQSKIFGNFGKGAAAASFAKRYLTFNVYSSIKDVKMPG